jgi:hypothetical protein
METLRLVPLQDLNLRAKVAADGVITGLIDEHGNDVLLPVINADGKFRMASGKLKTPVLVVTTPEYEGGAAWELPNVTGSTLEITETGTWDGGGTIVFTYAWLQDGVAIPGAEDATLLLTAPMEGSTLQGKLIATNSAGAAFELTDIITAEAAP